MRASFTSCATVATSRGARSSACPCRPRSSRALRRSTRRCRPTARSPPPPSLPPTAKKPAAEISAVEAAVDEQSYAVAVARTWALTNLAVAKWARREMSPEQYIGVRLEDLCGCGGGEGRREQAVHRLLRGVLNVTSGEELANRTSTAASCVDLKSCRCEKGSAKGKGRGQSGRRGRAGGVGRVGYAGVDGQRDAGRGSRPDLQVAGARAMPRAQPRPPAAAALQSRRWSSRARPAAGTGTRRRRTPPTRDPHRRRRTAPAIARGSARFWSCHFVLATFLDTEFRIFVFFGCGRHRISLLCPPRDASFQKSASKRWPSCVTSRHPRVASKQAPCPRSMEGTCPRARATSPRPRSSSPRSTATRTASSLGRSCSITSPSSPRRTRCCASSRWSRSRPRPRRC